MDRSHINMRINDMSLVISNRKIKQKMGLKGRAIILYCVRKASLIRCFILFYFYLFIYFYFTILYWFCHTSTCIRHGCTRVPHPEPSSHLPPHTIPLGHPSAPAPSFLYPASNLDW